MAISDTFIKNQGAFTNIAKKIRINKIKISLFQPLVDRRANRGYWNRT